MIYSHSQQMGVNVDDDLTLTTSEQIVKLNTAKWGNGSSGANWVVDEEMNDYYFDMREQSGSPTCYRVIANLPFEIYAIAGDCLLQSNFLRVKVVLDTRQGTKTREVFWQSPISEQQEVTMGLDEINSKSIMFDEIFEVVLPAQLRFYANKYSDQGGARLLGGKMNCFIYSLDNDDSSASYFIEGC